MMTYVYNDIYLKENNKMLFYGKTLSQIKNNCAQPSTNIIETKIGIFASIKTDLQKPVEKIQQMCVVSSN